jgi:hypothetical protein
MPLHIAFTRNGFAPAAGFLPPSGCTKPAKTPSFTPDCRFKTGIPMCAPYPAVLDKQRIVELNVDDQGLSPPLRCGG